MFDDQTGWGASDAVPTGDIVKDAMRKEQIIKWVHVHLISGLQLLIQTRDIVAFQDDLRGIHTS